MNEIQELPRLMDTYYHIKLVPKGFSLEGYNNNIDVYIKGEYLRAFIADVFQLYNIKIIEGNCTGFNIK